MQFVGFRVILKRIRAIKFMMMDKTVPWWKKALIIFGIVYLFLPVDIIPPMIPFLGFLDDILVWVLILYVLKDTLDTYWMGEKPVNYSGRFKNVIEDVEYEVVNEQKTKAGTESEKAAEKETVGGAN